MVLKTLQVEHVCLLLVYTLLTLGNARLQKGMRGVKLFILYNALACAGAGAVLLRGSLPNFLSIVVGNVCVLGCYTALYGSMHRLFGFSRKQHVLAATWLCLGVVSMVWLGWWQPATGPRLFVYSAVLACQQMQLAGLLLLFSGEGRRLSWMPGTFLMALAVANIVRMGMIASQGAPADYRDAGPGLAGIVLVNACLQCGLMVSYVWMAAARLRRDLEVQANTDPLTGLLNRRALETAAQRQMSSLAGPTKFSAILLDLDTYKPINDRLGHAAGDQALVAVARFLRQGLRAGDVVARTGGDEFMALLPQVPVEQAMDVAEELRASLAKLDLGVSDTEVRVTGSFGVAERRSEESWDDVCSRCDCALYAAKAEGGNAVRGCTAARPEFLDPFAVTTENTRYAGALSEGASVTPS